MKGNKQKKNKKIISLAFYTNQTGDVTKKFNVPSTVLSMASDRMQFKPALDAATNAGFISEIYSLHSENYSEVLTLKQADICLVTKMSANTNKLNQSMAIANLAALALLKNEGAKIIVQYCDNIFAKSNSTEDANDDLRRFYKCVFSMADAVTFPCEKMKRMTLKYLSSETKTFVINDPWQLSKHHHPKKLDANQRCRLIWFGNNKNLPYLLKNLDDIVTKSRTNQKFLLTIVSRKEAHDLTLKHLQHSGLQHPNWRLKFVEWCKKSPIEHLEKELAKSHISIIPSDPKDPLKAGVSHNRMVDSIRGGCVTIASPMDSYLEFSDIAILGNDFGEMLSKAINEYDAYSLKISKLQEEKLKKFDPSAVAKSWQEFWLNV